MMQCPTVQSPDGNTGIDACERWPTVGATDMRTAGVMGGISGVMFMLISSCRRESLAMGIAAAICMGQKLPSNVVVR